MSLRDKILAAIKANQPELVSVPVVDIKTEISGQLKDRFSQMLTGIGGEVVEISNLDPVIQDMKSELELGNLVVNLVPEIGELSSNITELTSARELEAVQKVFISGILGVAENGAVWVDQSKMVNRLLPFICQHLVIVLDSKELVTDMHEAYARVQSDKEGFGTFIAGPSKTADIEQSLVIGAHGARSLVVYLKV